MAAVEPTIPTKRQALATLERGDREVRALLDQTQAADLARPGIGGGDWSPIDLVAHLTSWERHAVEALAAWVQGERAPIDRALHERGVNGVNADTFAAIAGLTPRRILAQAATTHQELVNAIRAVPSEAWRRPPLGRGRPLAIRVGSILGGPKGPYSHADAHLPDLRRFVDR
jgi:hypothetical protein